MKQNAYAKVNIFLKITGHKEGYHTLLSRFMKVKNLYDTIEFIPASCKSLTIEGCGDIDTKTNTIYKAFIALNEYTGDLDILEYFYHHKVVVTKNIPSQAGLGGGSSDGATFMRMVNEVCQLGLDVDTLAKIGSEIGADFPFFIYDYESANVSGFGEVVEKFDEEALELEIYKPPFGCDTARVYKRFKKELLKDIKLSSFIGWNQIPSRELLSKIDALSANDLYKAALLEYPKLQEAAKEGWFFSGSGSSFFRVID
ncbi:MAG: 4-(cytidine 5'-diphospho)-2-C-methyl-D-erythritol kinase [Campylobacterales bacterium]|nr:4-(cytidine 5'-diphospho)-2-C-methyl-D-erythritol kinase [Campylobacterales bacterium]